MKTYHFIARSTSSYFASVKLVHHPHSSLMTIKSHQKNKTTTMKFLRRATNRCRLSAVAAKHRDENGISSVCSDSSSTHDITLCSSSPDSPRHSSEKKFTIRVTFAPDSENIVYEPSGSLSEEESDNYWYSREDFADFAETCKELAKEFHKLDRRSADPQSFGCMLKLVYDSCIETKQSNKSCILGNDEDETVFQRFLEKGSRRGMESMSVVAIHSSRARRKKDHCAAVFAAQDKSSDLSPSQRSSCIGAVSRRHSLASRLFAWRLAQ